MEVLLALFVFLLGLVIGSFLNVVVFRLNTGESLGGRSRCLHCGYQLRWMNLVPVFSYLLQGGRCSSCGSKISIQYMSVELVTGLVFLFSFLNFGQGALLLDPYVLLLRLLGVALLVAIVVYDIRHKIIPDQLVYTFIALSLVYHYLVFGWQRIGSLDLVSGPMLFLFFAALWFVSRGRWMGFGDAKLALGIGLLLGFGGGISAVLLAFWIGALYGLAVLLLQALSFLPALLTIKSEVPFAPFLVLGLMLVLFFGIDAIGLFT
jgi:prepilin signal peptidase PulO-like enzyme (type II secretory pathway)